MTNPTSGSSVSIHEAICKRDGSGEIILGVELTRAEAVARRQSGEDVVVCGTDPFTNARQAFAIESAVGPCKPDGPHTGVAGARALPHFQQNVVPPAGHTFYETPKRKVVI